MSSLAFENKSEGPLDHNGEIPAGRKLDDATTGFGIEPHPGEEVLSHIVVSSIILAVRRETGSGQIADINMVSLGGGILRSGGYQSESQRLAKTGFKRIHLFVGSGFRKDLLAFREMNEGHAF